MNNHDNPYDNQYDNESVEDASFDDSYSGRSGRHGRRHHGPDMERGPMGFLLGPDGPFGQGGIFGPDGPLAAFASGARSFDPQQFRAEAWAEHVDDPEGPRHGPGGRRGPRGPRGHQGPRGPVEAHAVREFPPGPGEFPFPPFGRRGGPGGQGGHGPARPGMRGGRGPGGPGARGPRGGGRRRRGDVRLAALLLIADEPRNGYQIIEELAARTEGAWRPSSGAVYPALAQLEDEGLIEAFDNEGRKAYRVTERGAEAVEQHGDAAPPWDAAAEQAREHRHSRGGGREGGALWSGLGQVGMATHAVSQSGDRAVIEAATALLAQTKKELYRLLADGAGSAASGESDDRTADESIGEPTDGAGGENG